MPERYLTEKLLCCIIYLGIVDILKKWKSHMSAVYSAQL